MFSENFHISFSVNVQDSIQLTDIRNRNSTVIQLNSIQFIYLLLTKKYNINTLKMIHNIPTITIFLLNYLQDEFL